jgi:hypothetical protein
MAPVRRLLTPLHWSNKQFSGTSLGDLIEIEGLNTVFRGSHTPERPLILGAAKTSIGHTEIVAGLVGIVKAIKQLAIGKVPGLSSLSAGKLNPEIDTALVPLHIPSNLTDLPMNDKLVPHRALVVYVLLTISDIATNIQQRVWLRGYTCWHRSRGCTPPDD